MHDLNRLFRSNKYHTNTYHNDYIAVLSIISLPGQKASAETCVCLPAHVLFLKLIISRVPGAWVKCIHAFGTIENLSGVVISCKGVISSFEVDLILFHTHREVTAQDWKQNTT